MRTGWGRSRAGALIGWAVSVAPAAVVVVITAVIAAVIYFGFATPASALSRAGGVCDRTAEVRDAVVAATGAGACGSVTALQLRDVVSLDLSNKSIASLNSGDFDGLYALDVLDMSDNSLMSLPAGVFDDLLLLRTLRLHGNSLPTLPAGIFDQLFLLEEITLNDNQFTSLPEGLFEELSRFDGFAANGDAPDNSASYPRIQRFIDRHSITSPEEFIAALPDAYKQRFVMMYSSEAPAAPHVSGDYPRVISFGGDGALTFAWNTDPSAPAMFRQSVEFLRQNDTDWTAGVIDFSGESPQIVEPASCQSCHSPLNKPMWGMWGEWSGSETATRGIFSEAVVQAAVAAMDRALASSDPRIEPLDFSASSFAGGTRFFAPPGRVPSVAAVEEAGAVWAWRHAEVLYGILRGRHTDFRSFSDGVVCTAHDQQASFALTLQSFSQPEQNLFVSDADEEFPDEPGYQPPYSNDLVSYTYYFHTDGSLGDAVLLLLIADVWPRRAHREAALPQRLQQWHGPALRDRQQGVSDAALSGRVSDRGGRADPEAAPALRAGHGGVPGRPRRAERQAIPRRRPQRQLPRRTPLGHLAPHLQRPHRQRARQPECRARRRRRSVELEGAHTRRRRGDRLPDLARHRHSRPSGVRRRHRLD